MNQEEQPTEPPSPFVRPLGPGSFLPPISRALLFMVLWYLLWIYLPRILSHALPGGTFLTRLAVVYLLLDAALLVESWLFLRAFDRRSFRTVGLWLYSGWSKEFMQGIGIGGALIGLVAAILAGLGALRYAGLSGGPGELLRPLGSEACVLLLAAMFEELAFRGYAFQRLLEAVGPLAAVLVFAGLFGVVHLTNPSATSLSTASTVLSGVLLAVAYLKTRGLWLPIGLHWTWNFLMGPILALPVSGIDFGATLLRARMSGATWLTGGEYGPEGGVVVVVVILPAIFYLARNRRLATSPAMKEALQ